MRRLAFLLLFTSTLLCSSTSSAQTKHFTNHLDFFEVGTTFEASVTDYDSRPPAVLNGYHFTILEKGRLNLLGLGLAWVGVNSTEHTSAYQDIALTTPIINVRLNKRPAGPTPPLFYFNVNYSYGLIHKKQGIFLGISLG